MTIKEEAQKELALRELSRRKLEYFTTYVDPFFWMPKWYIIKPFHRQIIEWIERLYRWETKANRLMISVPPQHWKSTISSQRFPLWLHSLDPTLNTVLASYSQELSKTHLSKIRQIINGNRMDKLGKIDLISDTATSYELKQWGTFTVVWVWWSLTGRPVDIGIIDDVHKDRIEYESDTIRNGVWDWYSSVFLSRLHNDSKQLLVMTRWGEDDLFWRILEKEWDLWEVINIPAITDEANKKVIFPEKFSYELLQQKREINERDFQSLYMWDPINEWGWDFKRDYFTYHDDIDPSLLKVYTFIDPAISQRQEADYTAIVTIWVDERNRVHILNITHDRLLPDDIINTVFSIVARYNPDVVGIEVVAYQKMLALSIRRAMEERNVFFNLEEVHPMWEKEARIKTMLQPRYSNLSIIHNSRDPKTKELELELLKFPNAKHDDIIDSLSGAISISQVQNKMILEPFNW